MCFISSLSFLTMSVLIKFSTSDILYPLEYRNCAIENNIKSIGSHLFMFHKCFSLLY